MSQLVKDLRDVILDLHNHQVASALDELYRIVYLLEDVEADHLSRQDKTDESAKALFDFESGVIVIDEFGFHDNPREGKV